MTETQMMQRVVAILTQAKQMSEASTAEIGGEQYRAQAQIVGEFVVEAMSTGIIALDGIDPQAVSAARSFQYRLGALVACFSAAYVHLALHYDSSAADLSSGDVLRQLALEMRSKDSA
ncbi:hypothetical protein ACF1AO_30350 [Streptomyces longwoodensis]|uniref:hypothetical protein n=1 Tax=Streptomyces longwoodensis TaxID=68231 RepID=UPI003702C892